MNLQNSSEKVNETTSNSFIGELKSMKFIVSKEKLMYLYFSLSLLVVVLSRKVVLVFQPLYNTISYGQLNDLFENILSAIYIILMGILVIKLFKRFTNVKLSEKKELLPVKTVLLLTLLTTVPILVISGILGWEVKLIADLGDKFTIRQFVVHVCSLLYIIPKMIFVTFSLAGFQKFFDLSFILEDSKYKQYIPFGSICLFLTFGLSELFLNIHDLSLIYFLMSFYFGVIYLITNKSISKTSFLVLLIYIF